MAAAMGGLDAVVFTGGVEENSAPIRAEVCRGPGFPGLGVDPALNEAAGEADEDLTADGARARARALLVRSREDLEIARSVRELLA